MKQASLMQLWKRPAPPQDGPRPRCTYTFRCGKCDATSSLSSLSADARGHLRPTRCKACGHPARPNNASCLECNTPWQSCRSRPTAMQTTATVLSGAAHTWCLTFATDFSGMDMTSCAMDRTLLGSIAVTQAWASDIWGPAKDFCLTNHGPERFSSDVRAKDLPGPPLHLYVAGPPCQPWARGGKQLGSRDHRAPLLDQVLRTIEACRPIAFLMEESDRVATYAGGAWWRDRVLELEAMQYHVTWSILNAAQHGVPQNRPRLWVVGIRRDSPGQPSSFKMPDPLPPELRLALGDILAPRRDTDNPDALPRAEGAKFNVLRVKERARSEGVTADWACAQGLSRNWGSKAAPRLVMPCLLHSNSVGYWLGSRGRHASVAEHARAQGVEHGAYRWPKDPTAFALLGNSMARCILQRLLHGILCMWGILEGPDPWLRGEAQGRLRAEGPPPPGAACSRPSPRPLGALRWGRLAMVPAVPSWPPTPYTPPKTPRWATRQQTQWHWQRARPPVAQRTLTRAVQQPQAQRLWQRRPHHPTIPPGRVLDWTAEAPTGSALLLPRHRIPPPRRATSTSTAAVRMTLSTPAAPMTTGT